MDLNLILQQTFLLTVNSEIMIRFFLSIIKLVVK